VLDELDNKPRLETNESVYNEAPTGKRVGKKIVAIGGGTGLSNLLRVLKELTDSLTAVVAMTDNGGSSGKLREEFGMLPPGDVRSCLVALSHAEPAMDSLLSYRFPEDSTLSGHNIGNLLLAAIMQAEGLDFAAATARLSALLAIQGRVLPATTDDVALAAVLEDGTVLHGETQIAADKREIRELFLQPENCRPGAEVLQAISEAEYIFIGPGSIYSSLISNLLVPGVAEAIKSSRAEVIYIANMATEPSELAAAELSISLELIEKYYRRQTGAKDRLVDKVVANIGAYGENALHELAGNRSVPIICDGERMAADGVELICGDFVDGVNFWQHDRRKLKERLQQELGL
jgi:uncharacterized cofD-like protein